VRISQNDILNAKNKLSWDTLSQVCLSNDEALNDVMQIIIYGEFPYVQRAAAIVNKVHDKKPSKLIPYIDMMIDRLSDDVHDAVLRNIFRIFQSHNFSEAQESKVMNQAFNHFQNRESAIAIRVFAMTTLVKLAEKYPELLNEIKSIVREEQPYMSAGMLSRSRRLGLL